MIQGIEEIPKCAICEELCKFNIKEKYYSSVCINHNANAIPEKRKAVSATKKSFSPEKIQGIVAARRKTNLERYGEENAFSYGSNSFKEVMVEKYGVEYGIQIPGAIEKVKSTCLKNNGVESIFQDAVKMEQCKIDKYGSIENFYQQQEISRQTTLEERYGESCIGNIKEFQGKRLESFLDVALKYERENDCTLYSHLLQEYGQGWQSLNLPRIQNGGRFYISNKYLKQIQDYSHSRSGVESYISNYIKENFKNLQVVENSRSIIPPYELDIYIPQKKLAIEYNGAYFHSTKHIKDPNYHKLKFELCKEKGIFLLQIFEDLWECDSQGYLNLIAAFLKQDFLLNYNIVKISDSELYIKDENEIISILKVQNSTIEYNQRSIKIPLKWECKLKEILDFTYLKIDNSKNIIKFWDENVWEIFEEITPQLWGIKNLNSLKRFSLKEISEDPKIFNIYDCGYTIMKIKGAL